MHASLQELQREAIEHARQQFAVLLEPVFRQLFCDIGFTLELADQNAALVADSRR